MNRKAELRLRSKLFGEQELQHAALQPEQRYFTRTYAEGLRELCAKLRGGCVHPGADYHAWNFPQPSSQRLPSCHVQSCVSFPALDCTTVIFGSEFHAEVRKRGEPSYRGT